MNQVLFHLAFPVGNIAQTKEFYVAGLGCSVGRETANSLILNLYGHQIVAHVTKELLTAQKGIYPRHFGLIFTEEADWESLLARAQQKQLAFYQEPKRRFGGLPTEHRTFFLEDPFSNFLEFKYYCQFSAIFGEAEFAQVGDAV
ncbi:VOC family protein [Aerosakkonemataceae cyanobacterium BLCC-F154]|uniref:VOC family protein n=1 Tax=Floridaenema fluviatile BLCC-F154 TaxID=3153640 RepID=A0ABV4YA80_9CYAN